MDILTGVLYPTPKKCGFRLLWFQGLAVIKIPFFWGPRYTSNPYTPA
jgi:hypothetical protein